MRKVVIAVLVLLFVLAGVIVFAVMNVNSLLEENRGALARLASEALGREVTYAKAEVAFPGRLSIEVKGLRVAEDPAFGKDDFLALETAYVSVEIWPALQRRIEISGVRLDRPTIRVIQTATGFNFDSLGAAEPAAAGLPPASPGDSESAPMALAIAGFRIDDATILYEDRTSSPTVALTIEEFTSSGTDILGNTPDRPIEISFSGLARPTGAKPGSAAMQLASRLEGDVRIRDMNMGALDLHLVSPSFHPLLLGFDFEEGDALERFDDFDLHVGVPANATAIGYPIHLVSSGGHIAGLDFELLDTRLQFRSPKVDIEDLAIGLLGGKVGLKGFMTFGTPKKSPFAFDTQLADLEADQLATLLLGTKPGRLEGHLGGNVDLAGDSLEWDVLKRSLAGQIDLDLREGALEEINVLNGIVQRLLNDPGLGQLAANSLRDVAPEVLEEKRTTFENINLDFTVAKGKLKADALELASKHFNLFAAGTLGLDGSVAGSGMIRLSEKLSAKILKKADAAAPLLGGENKIVEFPLLFSGMTNAMTLQPDIKALTARARANATDEVRQDAAKKLTDAIFGKKKAPVEGQEETQADRDRAAAENVIGRGLDSLFKKNNKE